MLIYTKIQRIDAKQSTSKDTQAPDEHRYLKFSEKQCQKLNSYTFQERHTRAQKSSDQHASTPASTRRLYVEKCDL